ncbi:hypothetical protein MPTK1_2g21200 [Marchantia polymorpha subsp. ruderalis]|nr:hypothetical protein Mp_2g21200 [Marchantia polymorpha subsp. ruderalis]
MSSAGLCAIAGVLYPDTDGREEWSQKKSQQWATWAQFVVPPASDGPIVASGQEIRQAAVQDPYHAYLYAALVTPENTADVTVGEILLAEFVKFLEMMCESCPRATVKEAFLVRPAGLQRSEDSAIRNRPASIHSMCCSGFQNTRV